MTPSTPSPSQANSSLPTCKAIGADAGGTKLALAFNDGTRTWYDQQPSVNLRTDAPAGFAARLAKHIRNALGDIHLDPNVHLCIGAAGAGTEAISAACRDALSGELGVHQDQVTVTSDARVALETAFPGDTGILIIAGTGSGCYGLDEDGQLLRAGGWGPGLEDPGSGSELGRAAVKHLLSTMEEGGPPDSFSRIIAGAMGLENPTISRVLDAYYQPTFHAAALAPAILDGFESENAVATELIHRQCTALVRQCARLIAKLESPPLERIAVTGGLANRDSYVRALSGALQQQFPSARATRLSRAPVEGALMWARRLQLEG